MIFMAKSFHDVTQMTATMPKKILIVAPNWIGDCLMAQPLFACLKQTGAHITLLAPEWVAPIAQLMPEIDAVVPNRFAHGKLQWRARRVLAAELRTQQFDTAYVLPNSLKSGLIPWLAGIPLRIGYQGEARWGLLHRRLPNPSKQTRPLMHAHYAALATLQGIRVPDPLPAPRLVVPPALQAQAQTHLHTQGVADAPFWVMAPGAEYGPAKRWPAQRCAELALQALAANPQRRVLLLGSAKDGAVAQEIIETLKALAPPSNNMLARVHNLCGRTSLDLAAAILAQAEQVISNDSGLMHVAAALDAPQVAVYGSSDPRHTPPLSARARVVWLHLSCSPCFKRECPLGTLACLQQIDAAQVFALTQTSSASSTQGV
jgi:heptosyltransferase-2